MGLDTVEWVMGFEAHLGERLPDEVAFKLRTLGDALDLFEQRFGHQRGFCATQRTYHQLSQARGTRRLALDAAVGRAPFPRALHVPTELSLGAALTVTATVLTGVAGGIALGGGAGLAAGAAGVAVASALAKTQERPCGPTVRDLVRATTCRNYGALLRAGAAWSRALGREALFSLSADQAGVREEELTEQTRFCDLFPD